MLGHFSERIVGKVYNHPARCCFMENDFALTTDNEPDGPALDHLLHSKSKILRTKLEVLASEIQARFAIWDRNLDRLNDDKSCVESQLGESTRLARYHLRDAREATRLQDALEESMRSLQHNLEMVTKVLNLNPSQAEIEAILKRKNQKNPETVDHWAVIAVGESQW